ncbi:MAG: hypothetical protein J5656_00185 [Clostridia bacterium]|nr:hypothetical protein [Clostridia bacterium]
MNKKIIALIAVIAIVAILGVCLVACNAKSYQSKLEKKGYTVSVSENEKDDNNADVEWVVSAQKGGVLSGDFQAVTIAKYKNVDDAKKAEKDAKDGANNGIISYKVSRSGKIVIVGTEQGVKDAK